RIRRRRDRSPLCVTGCEEDIMNVFLAGGSGAIGVPLVRALVAAGHQVTALTRFAANEPKLRALGATPAVADALDAEALRRVVAAARPSHVIHQLTALTKAGPRSARDLAPTNRLPTAGPIHLEDAASATIAALERWPAGSVYDIVDDRAVSMSEMALAIAESVGAPRPIAVPSWLPRLLSPYMARMMAIRLPLSNEKARVDLGWRPSYPTIHEGLSQLRRHAA